MATKKQELVIFDAKAYTKDIKSLAEGYAKLPKNLQEKHIKAAMNRAFRPFEKDFRQQAPKSGGGLRKSVGTKTYFARDTRQWVTKVGYMRSAGKVSKKTGKRTGVKQGAHAIFVNDGTKERVKNSTGQSVGVCPPQNFFARIMATITARARPAIEQHLGEALEKAVNEMGKQIERRRTRKANSK
jgi:hypothetical protein